MKETHQNARQALRQAGIENPEREARLILKHVLGVTDADLIAGNDHLATPAQTREIERFLQRRMAGEPLSRILGEREFWGLPFRVTPDVLDPRPDTETIIEAALKSFPVPPASILDLGTGSGCILIALLHEWRQARGVGVDISPEALAVAAENARMNGVADRISFIHADFASPPAGKFDLIVSNPPYIPSADIPNLDPEVRNHDPILALDGGKDGLRAYIMIISQIKNLLSPGGVVLLELGIFQGHDVARLAADAGLSVNESFCDLGGIERVLKLSFGDSGEK